MDPITALVNIAATWKKDQQVSFFFLFLTIISTSISTSTDPYRRTSHRSQGHTLSTGRKMVPSSIQGCLCTDDDDDDDDDDDGGGGDDDDDDDEEEEEIGFYDSRVFKAIGRWTQLHDGPNKFGELRPHVKRLKCYGSKVSITNSLTHRQRVGPLLHQNI